MSTLKRWESAGHIALGFLCELLPLRLLLDRREDKQLPPENDRYPVLYLGDTEPVDCRDERRMWIGGTMESDGDDEYWSKARVMDTLRDMREYSIGGTIGWFLVFGAGIALGKWVL